MPCACPLHKGGHYSHKETRKIVKFRCISGRDKRGTIIAASGLIKVEQAESFLKVANYLRAPWNSPEQARVRVSNLTCLHNWRIASIWYRCYRVEPMELIIADRPTLY
jgi:hypothetical protein